MAQPEQKQEAGNGSVLGGPPDDMLYFAQYLRLHVGATSVSRSFRNDVPSLLLVFIQ